MPIPSLRCTVTERLRAAGCVSAESEAALLIDEARTSTELAGLVDRRGNGEPLEHILGWVDFYGMHIAVDPGVFVPRQRSQLLVREAVVLLRDTATEPRVVVDLCCGSGALGAALLRELAGVELHAADINPAAVRCARRNVAAPHRVYQGDLYEPLPPALRGRVDVVVANAPYVPTDAVRLLPAEAREHEPRRALHGGVDGLDLVRRIVAEAPGWLSPGGHLLVETSATQASQLTGIVASSGMSPRVADCEELNAVTVIGTMPPLPSQGARAGSPTLPQ